MKFLRKEINLKGSRISDSNLQPLDLLLAVIGSSLALYSLNESISATSDGYFFIAINCVGSFFSFFILQFFGDRKFVAFDPYLYTLMAGVVAACSPFLFTLTPDNVFTDQVMVAGILCWMISIGSFFVWRDQTMLFQSIPSIALFGLVGCYDTFSNAVFLFFAFILCQTLLLGRANSRVMLRQASTIEKRELALNTMRASKWKWMAGPEWALGSGLAVVLFSLISAPVLRQSASSFTGLVHYTPPSAIKSSPYVIGDTNQRVRVGTGPRQLNSNPLFRATIPSAIYLRSAVWTSYQDGSWVAGDPYIPVSNSSDYSAPPSPPIEILTSEGPLFTRDPAIGLISHAAATPFILETIGRYRGTIPVPVETLAIESEQEFARSGAGYSYQGYRRPAPVLRGVSIQFDGRKSPRTAALEVARQQPELLDTGHIAPEVRDLAKSVTKDAPNDYQKAILIQSAIEERCIYDLNAPATPTGQDPVATFLTESKRGYCDLFASSMVQMARSVGLPARYVTGYLPFDDDKDSDGRYIIRTKYAHAWAEILFKDAGWVIFDATEGADSASAGLGSDNSEFWRSPWFYIPVALVVLGCIAVAAVKTYRKLIAWFSLEAFRARRRERASRKVKMAAVREIRKFERQIQRAVRRPRNSSETLHEYLTAAAPELGTALPQAQVTARLISSVLYGMDGWSSGELTEVAQANSKLRDAINQIKR